MSHHTQQAARFCSRTVADPWLHGLIELGYAMMCLLAGDTAVPEAFTGSVSNEARTLKLKDILQDHELNKTYRAATGRG